MLKMITLLAMAVGALVAFAVPAAASASELTNEGGGAVATETTISAVSRNVTTVTEIATFRCNNVEIGGEVAANSGGTVTVGMLETFPETTEGCGIEQTGTQTPSTMTFKHLHLDSNPAGTNTMEVTYFQHFPVAPGVEIICHWEGTVGVTSVPGSTSIHAAGTIAGTSGGGFCPPGANFSADFALSNENGPVTID